MKFCRNCGTQMEDDSAFCPACGKAVSQTQATPPEVTQAVEPEQPYAPQGDPSDIWPADGAQTPQKRPKTGLIVGIAAAALVVVAAVVFAVIYLMPGDPMHQFGGGMTGFFSTLGKLPTNEVTTRMKTEAYDVSLNTNLSDLLTQVAPGQNTGMPDNLTLKADVKNTGKNGGVLLAVSSGGADLFKLVGIVTDDKLIAGYSSPMLGDGGMKSAALALKGKPGDPLEARIADSKSGNQDLAKEIGSKLLKYTEESVDSKWFTVEDSSIQDPLTGGAVKTKAAVLTLDADKTIQLLKKLSAKLDADATFYADLDKLQAGTGTADSDSKTQYQKMFADAEKNLQGKDFALKAMVHYAGLTPVAMEITADLKGEDAFNMDLTLQKTTKGNSTAYLFSMKGQEPQNGSQSSDVSLSLTVDKTASGYGFDGKLSANSGSEAVTLGVKGTADIEKKSSNEYSIGTKAAVSWVIPETTPGSVNATLNESVTFGSAVKSIQADSDYLYDELKGSAKEVSSLEDFISALTGLNGLSSIGY